MTDTNVMSCPVCDNNISKEQFLAHIKKCSPEYFANEVFSFPPQDKWSENIDMMRKFTVDDAIKILEGTCTYWYADDKAYVEFHTGKAYSKEGTVLKHIGENTKEHSDGFYKLLKESITKDKLIELLKWIKQRPPQKIMDEALVTRAENKVKAVTQEYEKKIEYLEQFRKKWEDYEKSEEGLELKRVRSECASLSSEMFDLRAKCNNLQREVRELSSEREAHFEKLRSSFTDREKDDENMTVWEKKYIRDKKSMDVKNEKLISKLKAEHDKKLESLEKREKKYKKEIASLKHQLKLKEYESSDSSEDSD